MQRKRWSRTRPALGWRAAVVVTAVHAGCLGATALALAPLRDLAALVTAPEPPVVTPADALALLCAVAVAAGGLWLAVVSTVVVAEALVTTTRTKRGSAAPPSPAVRLGCPAAWRRLLLAGCGFALAGGVTVGPSYADPPRRASGEPAATAAGARAPAPTGVLTGLTVPDRVTGSSLHSLASPSPDRLVRVRPGDSLWSLSAVLLPALATDAEVARAWRLLYAANRTEVGPNPDLIHPGTVLTIPPPLIADTRDTTRTRTDREDNP